MKRIVPLLLLGVLVSGTLFNLWGDMSDSAKEDFEYERTASIIADDFENNKEIFYMVANTLPENYVIQGGETSETKIYVKNNVTGQKFYSEEIKDIDSDLYVALCDMQKNNIQFYSIECYGGCITFTTTIKDFTSFSILHVSSDATLENVLTRYDSYTTLEKGEWYIVWRTRGGV